jgi:two-component system KDP operon response regulator KdpE
LTNKPIILVIDDEQQIQRLLELTLQPKGYDVRFANTGEEGTILAASERPELIILDLGLPDMDGIEVLRRIREWTTIPVLVLSVRNSESDIVSCLDAGANDYLVKPFRTGELSARVRVALRQHQTQGERSIFAFHGLTVDLRARTVKRGTEFIKLTATEYALLVLFVRNAGRVLTHRFILEQVWGPTHSEEAQYTRVYVGSLRKKIERDPSNPKILLTESGIGYRLNVDE